MINDIKEIKVLIIGIDSKTVIIGTFLDIKLKRFQKIIKQRRIRENMKNKKYMVK